MLGSPLERIKQATPLEPGHLSSTETSSWLQRATEDVQQFDPKQPGKSIAGTTELAAGFAGPAVIKGIPSKLPLGVKLTPVEHDPFVVTEGPVPANQPEMLNYKSAGATPGGERVPLPERLLFDRPPTAQELREVAQYEKIKEAARLKAEARKAKAVPSASGETLGYKSAGAVPGAANEPGMHPEQLKQSIEAQQPKTFGEYVTQHTKGMDVLESDALWAKAEEMSKQSGKPFNEAFAQLANEAWTAHGTNRYITPEIAQKYINKARAELIGIKTVPVEHDPFLDPPVAVQAAVPTTDVAGKIRAAYEVALREQGGGNVWISDVAQRSGVPISDLHKYLLREAKAGGLTLHPTTIVRDKFPIGASDAAVNLPGHDPLLTMRMK